MRKRSSICWFLATACLGLAGCSTPGPLRQTPLGQDQVDQFLAGGRDARMYGITIYPDPAGTRFEFANRPHADRAAQLDFVSPSGSPFPVVEVRSALTDPFPMLLDSSARQSWAALASAKGLEYRIFAPPTGEYADHVVADIPGYAGVGNKLIFDKLHVESPIYCMAPAAGGLGALSRAAERPDLAPAVAKARDKFARRIPVAMGAAAMRGFAFVRFDFPGRSVRFSSTRAYAPANPSAVAANLPLLDWRGRPAVQAMLDGEPIILVIDTAGDFDLSLPGTPAAETGALALGALVLDDVNTVSHASRCLPEDFPARLGLGILARFAVTLDQRNRRVWFEEKSLSGAAESATPTEDEMPAPVQYRGITR